MNGWVGVCGIALGVAKDNVRRWKDFAGRGIVYQYANSCQLTKNKMAIPAG